MSSRRSPSVASAPPRFAACRLICLAERRIEPDAGHCTCPDCGERAAAIYTVIETCKLNGVEPQAYIADVIEKIASGWPSCRWDDLMPWSWQPADQLLAEAA